jgi:hypothetical protein
MAQLVFHQNKEDRGAALGWSLRGIEALSLLDSAAARQEEGYLRIRYAAILAQSGQLGAAQQATLDGIQLLPGTASAARISALTNLGIIHAIGGHATQAVDYWSQAIEDAEIVGDSRRLADLRSNIGAVATRQGRFPSAIAEKNAALELCRRMGDVVGETRILLNLGEDYLFLQAWTEAHAHLTAALRAARAHGLKNLELSALINQTQLELQEQRQAEAELTLQTAAMLSATHASPDQRAELLRLQAELAYQRAELATAFHLANRARKLTNDARERGLIWRISAEILSQARKKRWAECAFAHSAAAFAQTNPFELARTHSAQADHHLRYNEQAQAVALLTAAHALFGEVDNIAYRASTEVALATLGQPTSA